MKTVKEEITGEEKKKAAGRPVWTGLMEEWAAVSPQSWT